MRENYDEEYEREEYLLEDKDDELKSLIGPIALIIVIAVIVCIAVLTWMKEKDLRQEDYNYEIKGGYIQRDFTELIGYLQEEPEDITAQPYEAHNPEIIRRDIEKMDAFEEVEGILYYNASCRIEIRRYESGEIIFNLNDDRIGYSMQKVSVYRKEDNIIIYGIENSQYRILSKLKIRPEEIEFSREDNYKVDLFGTNISQKEDKSHETYGCSSEMILLRDNQEFSFYRQGKQIGETTVFPGGKITKTDYRYILDEHKDLYYVYYCAVGENPWIKFIKVAKNVNKVLGKRYAKSENFVSVEVNTNIGIIDSVEYPIFKKKNRKYAAILNPETEKKVGFDRSYDASFLPEEIDFKVYTIDLSKPPKVVKFVTTDEHAFDDSYDFYSKDYDWYAEFYYDVPYKVYTRNRINGLDSGIIPKIPKKKLKSFHEKEVSFKDFDKTVKALKRLYRKYE